MRIFINLFVFLLITTYIFSGEGYFILHKSVKSKYLSFPHNVIVYLPADYSNSTKRYPVLYAHDGQNLFNPKTAFGGNEWKLDENIDELINQGLLDGIIVVGIYNNAERISEYTPTFISNEWVVNQGGKLTNYAKFIVEELKPFIDENYRTLPDRLNTGVMGSSLGGIASFYILGLYPDVFSKAACISPSFWWDNVRVTNDFKNLKFPSDCKIYIDGGFKEGGDEASMISYMRLVYNQLLNSGLKIFDNLYYYEDPYGAHNEFEWAKRGKYPILFLFGKFIPDIKDVKIYIIPNKLGINDTSFISAEIIFQNNLKFTEFKNYFSIKDNDILNFNNGYINGLKEGKTSIIFTYNNKEYSKEIEVMPISREIVPIKLFITSRNKINKISLNIIKENKIQTNYIVDLTMLDEYTGYIEFVKKIGHNLQYEIVNDKNEKAYNEDDKIIQLSLTFNKPEQITNTIDIWK